MVTLCALHDVRFDGRLGAQSITTIQVLWVLHPAHLRVLIVASGRQAGCSVEDSVTESLYLTLTTASPHTF